jgi:hypothetical protein
MLADPRLKPLHDHREFQAMTATLNRMGAEAELNLPLEA